MSTIIVSLSEIGKKDIERVGGKALNLAKLISAGFPVPQGFIVPVDAYEKFLLDNKLQEKILHVLKDTNFDDEASIESCSRNIKNLIISGTIENEMGAAIVNVLLPDEHTLWAVRSSAVAEDLPDASFAGQQDTFLNVDTEHVPECVKVCWASYWNERAIAYRYNAGIPHLKNGIATVIQKMVDARTSGIMFTTDPVNERKNEIIIESSWGLGESIVSGLVTPDRFSCDKSSLKILNKKISKKSKGIFSSHEKSITVDIEPSRQKSASLTEDEIHALATLGKKIEYYFDTPQDIEWSIENDKVYILQSRPITTLKSEETLWTRAYGDEYWADVTSPLFFSLLGEYLTKYVNHEGAKIMGYKELIDTDLLRLHKGHIYFNSEVLERVFTFNPKFSRTKELLNYFPEKDQDRIANAKTKTLRRLWAEIRIMLLDPDGMITRTDGAYRKWAEYFLSQMKSFDSLDLTQLSEEELYDEFKKMEAAYLKHYRLIRYGMVTHSIGTNLMIKRWLHDWLGDTSGELYSALISGLPDNKTIKTNMTAAALTRSARKDDNVLSLLKQLPSDEFLKELNTAPSLEKFNIEFHKFLKEYGHRSHTREIYFPRWTDDPTLVIDILKTLIMSPDINFEEMEKKKIEERIDTEREVFERISHLKYGVIKKLLFKIVLKYAQIYLIFRENQRFYLDHTIYRWRRLFMEYGRRFTEKGIIEKEDEIFFLSKEEIFQIARGEASDVVHKILQRKEEFEKYAYTLPPKFLKGNTEFDDTVMQVENVVKITGTSASPGTAVGVVRVIDSIKDLSTIMESEILVTSNTDPGWTPVFSKLSGLITETGGILSHGAVVSREYGIPAVTAVKNATKIFKTGQKITIDGNEGVIYIVEE